MTRGVLIKNPPEFMCSYGALTALFSGFIIIDCRMHCLLLTPPEKHIFLLRNTSCRNLRFMKLFSCFPKCSSDKL